MPSFPGGEDALFEYLDKNVKYPSMAKDAGISERVYVTFVVNEKGNIKDTKLLRVIGGDCDEEAIRVVGSMPNWSPGKNRGNPGTGTFRGNGKRHEPENHDTDADCYRVFYSQFG